jgi:hypothetical protein
MDHAQRMKNQYALRVFDMKMGLTHIDEISPACD